MLLVILQDIKLFFQLFWFRSLLQGHLPLCLKIYPFYPASLANIFYALKQFSQSRETKTF